MTHRPNDGRDTLRWEFCCAASAADRRALLLTALLSVMLLTGCGGDVRVGSKAFTESVILGEMARLKGTAADVPVEHRKGMGGTQFLWKGLLWGDIDAYPDYTGTIEQTILTDLDLPDDERARYAAIKEALAEHGVEMTAPLGFNNTYAIGMREKVAKTLNISKISDLRDHPDLSFGFSPEFMKRDDGWPGLKAHYELPHTGKQVRGVDHTLAYEALMQGDIQAMDLYSTDPKIRKYNLRILEDDRAFFPDYSAVFLYRADLKERAPRLVAGINELAGAIDAATMVELNARVELDQQQEGVVAGSLLDMQIAPTGRLSRLWRYTLEHLFLVGTSLTMAICVAIPLGVVAVKRPRWEKPIMITAEIIQTIPALALLVILMLALGRLGDGLETLNLARLPTIGPLPAIAALFSYSLLPILRNTHAGITGIPGNLQESAEAIGLSPQAQLWQIELPMASRLILAGIKTTAVINVGYATLGGLISAGGYGQPIIQGLYKMDFGVMMEGAIPAAVMAICVKSLFEWSELLVVPQGLRLKASH